MPLPEITPFGPAAYEDRVRRVAERSAQCAQDVWGLPWDELLAGFYWRGADLSETLTLRRDLHDRIARARNETEFLQAVDAILRWGGMPPWPERRAAQLSDAVAALADGAETNRTIVDLIVGYRIASASKVYGVAIPDRWIIYDSRVAASLATLVTFAGDGRPPGCCVFPQPPGRVAGRAVTGFPTLAHAKPREAALAFLYASWMARALAAALTREGVANPAGGNWTAMHVEMALFMAGGRQLGSASSNEEGGIMAGPAIKAAMATAGTKLLDAGSDSALEQARMWGAQWNEEFNAFRNAARYAKQTNGRMVRLQFPYGKQHYVVFKNDQTIATFPGYEGDVDEALAHHELDTVEMLTADEAIERRRRARADAPRESRKWIESWWTRLFDRDDTDGAVVAAAAASAGIPLLAMRAESGDTKRLVVRVGDPLGDDGLSDEVFDDNPEGF